MLHPEDQKELLKYLLVFSNSRRFHDLDSFLYKNQDNLQILFNPNNYFDDHTKRIIKHLRNLAVDNFDLMSILYHHIDIFRDLNSYNHISIRQYTENDLIENYKILKKEMNNAVGEIMLNHKAFEKIPRDIIFDIRDRYLFGKLKLKSNKRVKHVKHVKYVKGTKIEYYPSTRKNKKWMTITPDGKKVHWGHPTMKDYTQHHDKKRRKSFRSRMSGIKTKSGKKAIDKKWSPAWLSYYVTW